METLDRAELVRRYAEASRDDDFETLARLRHPEWQETWPQSGEIVTSSANYHDLRVNRPEGAPRVEIGASAGGSGDDWWAELIVHYADGSRWLAITLIELRDGLVHRERIYFGQPFAPPAWRAKWVTQGPPAIS
jgi:hypothetical protein